MSDEYWIVPLGGHDRTQFGCGVEALDRYFETQASQDARRNISNCFVALDSSGAIGGYYTFAAASILAAEVPVEAARRLPRYPQLPAALVGRLAVDLRHRGRGLGSAMILDAVRGARESAPAVFALVVDAKDEAAVAFYRKLGFQSFSSRPISLLLPIATAERALSGS